MAITLITQSTTNIQRSLCGDLFSELAKDATHAHYLTLDGRKAILDALLTVDGHPIVALDLPVQGSDQARWEMAVQAIFGQGQSTPG